MWVNTHCDYKNDEIMSGSIREVFSKWASITTRLERKIFHARVKPMEANLESHLAQQDSHIAQLEKIVERFVKEDVGKVLGQQIL